MTNFLALTLLLCFSISTLAEEKSPPIPAPPKISASYKALIKDLMKYTHTTEGQNAAIEEIASSLSKDAKDPAVAKKSVIEFLNQHMSIDAMLTEISESYAKHFSEAEIKELVKFYKTPTGSKAAVKVPEVNKDMMTRGQLKMGLIKKEFEMKKDSMKGFK